MDYRSPNRRNLEPLTSGEQSKLSSFHQHEESKFSSPELPPVFSSPIPSLNLPDVPQTDGSNIEEETKSPLNLFQRDSPRAKKTLHSFMTNFVDNATGEISLSIDLAKHYAETREPITDTMVQELCAMVPDMISLSLAHCALISDAALWAVARHCPDLQKLTLDGCHAFTNLGLRSLALRCHAIQVLEFRECPSLDDQGLKAIAGGCWELDKLFLPSCPLITDSGIADVARCCGRLRIIDLSECDRIGEFGDRALLEIGRHCPLLEDLNMFGCRHVQDPGLLAIARGCPLLLSLKLSGCREITTESVYAIASKLTRLRTLSLSGCVKVSNRDLALLASHTSSIQELDISHCEKVYVEGIDALSSSCKSLVSLNVSYCGAVSDDALFSLARGSPNLRKLNVSFCTQITSSSVEFLARNLSRLEYFILTGCNRVSRRFLMLLLQDLPYSQVSHDFFGYEPKPNADALRLKREREILEKQCAVLLQSVARRMFARIIYRKKRNEWVVNEKLKLGQALVRGHICRVKLSRKSKAKQEVLCAIKIQTAFRCWSNSSKFKSDRERIQNYVRNLARVVLIQKIMRGKWGRKIVVKRRNEVRKIELRKAKIQAKWEISANVIQRNVRKMWARKILLEKRRLREIMLEAMKKRERASLHIQRILRGKAARVIAERKRKEAALVRLRFRSAMMMQTIIRMFLAKCVADKLRIIRDHKIAMRAATQIQRIWRGMRGRYFALMARAMRELRIKENKAAIVIQSQVRIILAKKLVREMKEQERILKVREISAMNIQKTFRGHKGREYFEIQRNLRRFEGQAAPLIERLEELNELYFETEKRIERLGIEFEEFEEDTHNLEEEMVRSQRTNAKFTDSSRVNGTPQRFLTKFIAVRLEELYEEQKVKVQELAENHRASQVELGSVQVSIRQTRRELIPMTSGLIDKTRLERTGRLRELVRAKEFGSVEFQRLVYLFFLF